MNEHGLQPWQNHHIANLAAWAASILGLNLAACADRGIAINRSQQQGCAVTSLQVWDMIADRCALCLHDDEVVLYKRGPWENVLREWAREVTPHPTPLPGGEAPAPKPCYGSHAYTLDGTSDCAHGCGCWMGPYRSGGPDGIDPSGRCPKNPLPPHHHPLLGGEVPDHVQLTLDLAAMVLAEAAEEELARMAHYQSPLNPLEELGCIVLRVAERQRAAVILGDGQAAPKRTADELAEIEERCIAP